MPLKPKKPNQTKPIKSQLLQAVEHKLSYVIKKNHYQHKLKIQKKINNLANGSILLLNNDNKSLNPSMVLKVLG